MPVLTRQQMKGTSSQRDTHMCNTQKVQQATHKEESNNVLVACLLRPSASSAATWLLHPVLMCPAACLNNKQTQTCPGLKSPARLNPSATYCLGSCQ